MHYLLLVAVLSVMVMAAHSGPCDSYGNGCSIPFGLPYFYKDLFTPACNRHDVCYGCGALKGITRRSCDDRFLRDMRAACAGRSGRREVVEKRSICDQIARGDYYNAVRAFGSSHYRSASNPESYCSSQTCL